MPHPRIAQICYHIGRLTTYLILGFLAGLIGEKTNIIGSLVGMSELTASVTGSIMVISACFILINRPLHLSRLLPRKLFSIPHSIISRIPKSGLLYGYALGLFSTLLPCGWLYTYVALAAATAHPISGSILMGFFWIGTLPILVTIGSLSHLISSRLSRYIPKIIALCMLAAGFFAISGHLTPLSSEGMCEHHHSAETHHE